MAKSKLYAHGGTVTGRFTPASNVSSVPIKPELVEAPLPAVAWFHLKIEGHNVTNYRIRGDEDFLPFEEHTTSLKEKIASLVKTESYFVGVLPPSLEGMVSVPFPTKVELTVFWLKLPQMRLYVNRINPLDNSGSIEANWIPYNWSSAGVSPLSAISGNEESKLVLDEDDGLLLGSIVPMTPEQRRIGRSLKYFGDPVVSIIKATSLHDFALQLGKLKL